MPLLLTPRSPTAAAARVAAPIRRDAGTITIGRDPRNDLVLDHPSASGRHCVVTGSDAAWQVQDNSTNGTKVNGQRINGAHMLRHGDVITVADLDILVAVAGGQQPVSSAAAASWHRPTSAQAELGAATGMSQQLKGNAEALTLAAVACIARLEAARRKALADVGVPAPSTSPDPFAAGDSEAVTARLAAMPPAAAAAAITQACGGLVAHERAMLAAMQATFRATLDHFAPAAIKARTNSDADAWKAYERAFNAADGFVETFAQELAKAYRNAAAGR